MPTRFRQTYGFLFLLAAAGCFLLVPFDLAMGDYSGAAGRVVAGIVALALLPRPTRRRI
jgi:hypothetical protein